LIEANVLTSNHYTMLPPMLLLMSVRDMYVSACICPASLQKLWQHLLQRVFTENCRRRFVEETSSCLWLLLYRAQSKMMYIMMMMMMIMVI